MKILFKKYWILELVLIFLLSVFAFNISKYLNNSHSLEKADLEAREMCSNDIINKDTVEYCEQVEKTPVYKIDFYSMFYSTYSQGYHSIVFIVFILITISSIKTICSYFKNNILKNILTRQEYRKTILKLIAEAYKPVIIIPMLTIIAFIVCYISTGNFDYNNALQNSSVNWSQNSMQNPALFMITYVLRTMIISAIYINISLCVCKKNHNFLITTILSYLYFIAIEIFLEVVCNMLIFTTIFKSGFGVVLNIISIFSLFDYYGYVWSIIIPLLLFFISILMVYIKYKDKENLIIECEKNN